MQIRARPLPFWIVFAVTWSAYATTYLLRKPLGVIKSAYSTELGLSNTQLGGLDMAMLLAYAIFQMVFGMWADVLGPRRTMSVCMFGSGMALMPFIVFNRYAVYVLMLFASGAFQSFCWAACNSGITKWFEHDKEKRQTILGYFGTSPFAGGILGTIIAVETLKRFPWTYI